MEVLLAAGFAEEENGGVKMLRLRRDDPGLLWLCLSAIDSAKQSTGAHA